MPGPPIPRRHPDPRRPRLAGLAALALAGVLVPPAHAAERVDGFRTKMEKWVETRQLISEERTDWKVEEETLRATKELLRQQKQDLEEEVASLDASITEADQERLDLLLQRGELQRATTAMDAHVRDLEQQVVALVPRLPEPLQERLDPLIVQIPEDPEQSKVPLGARLVNVLGILLQSEKWNGTASFVGETRAVDASGEKVQVRTLYWGLGQAVYVDAKGRNAGIGRPGADGWKFSEEPGLADAARRFLDIYEGNVDAIEFVKLPVRIVE
jgi:hypothetical protein